jgi:predicted esterase
VCAHSTGLEADAMLRWAVRHVPDVAFCATLPATGAQGTRRRPSIDRIFRRFDEVGMRRSAAVFVETEAVRDEVIDAGRTHRARRATRARGA